MVYSQCMCCRNYILGKKCWAFPNGIPSEVFENKVTHDHKITGQNGKFTFQSTSV